MDITMEFIKPIIAKIEEYLLERIKQQCRNLFHLNSNIKNLKDQFQKLGDKRRGVQSEIDAKEQRDNWTWVQNQVEKVDNINISEDL